MDDRINLITTTVILLLTCIFSIQTAHSTNLYSSMVHLVDNKPKANNHHLDTDETIELSHPSLLCPMGFFRCNATMHCVAQRKNCDGFEDCSDGSDEWDCADDIDSLFWDHLFKKNPAARSDDIPMGLCVWMNLNNTCLCRGNELHCQHKALRRLPTNLPDDGITLLDLTGNTYPIIDEHFFDLLPEVDTLVLKHCSIEVIKSKAFSQLDKIFMHTLYLDQNKIETLPTQFFPPNTRLHVLILSGNRIADLHSTAFINLEHLLELDLRNNEIVSFLDDVFKPLVKLEILYLNDNRIIALTAKMLPPLTTLLTLSLADNRIQYISKMALRLPSLENLFLSGNQITIVYNNTFRNLPNLLGMNLNDNKINEFQLAAFGGIENLTSLYLKGNEFQTLNEMVLRNLTNLQYVYFSWFHLCKAAMHVRVCEPHGDGISSTRHLLDNTVLRGSVWIMASVGIFGNLLVLCGRLLTRSKRGHGHVEHSLYLRHLAASDLIMGVYLAVIAIADIMFRGEYLLHEEKWRHSVTCAICGFLSTLSCQSSTLLLTLVTWDRLISVTRPLHPRSSSRMRAIIRLSVLWGASGIAAASPLSATSYFGNHFYGNNGVCLSLHIHDPYAKGWEYSAAMFILVNTLSLLFIFISYIRMLQAIRGSGEAMRSTLSGRENAVARRFAIIVATDCACWLPIIAVKLAALSGVPISPSLYAWLAVLVLPVNSALNPVLYTLTTAAFKQQITKFIYSLPCSSDMESRTQNGYESALSFSMGHMPPTCATKHLLQRRTTQSTLTSSCKRAAVV